MEEIKIENHIYISITVNLISFLSNFSYLSIPSTLYISMLFKLVDSSKLKFSFVFSFFIIKV